MKKKKSKLKAKVGHSPDDPIADKRTHLFKKGQSGNPAGRPKGSCNKFSLGQFHAALMSIEKKKQKDLYIHVAEMCYKNPMILVHVLSKLLPDMRAIDLTGNLDIGNMDEEAAKKIRDRLKARFEMIEEHAESKNQKAS